MIDKLWYGWSRCEKVGESKIKIYCAREEAGAQAGEKKKDNLHIHKMHKSIRERRTDH